MSSPKEALLDLLKKKSFTQKEVVLSSGKKSNFYIDCKKMLLTPEGFVLTGYVLYSQVVQQKFAKPVRGVGGLTMGADPLAYSLSMESYIRNKGALYETFVVRKEPKKHGSNQWIERPEGWQQGDGVVILEDVVTTGASALLAIERCRVEGLDPLMCFALVDRLEGGREAIESAGVPVKSLFTRKDFMSDP